VARILIVGGGCRGRRLARELAASGHAVRITTRSEARRAEIEGAGAECWIGTPARLSTLRGALDGATLACWMLARPSGPPDELRALHGRLLEGFVRQLIDTTVRGLVYDASPPAPERRLLESGTEIVESLAAFNAIPAKVLAPARDDDESWIASASSAVEELLRGRSDASPRLSSW
jgi:NAD(P)-dependent dehydrogenase (short-subunit alcohol dehydrogenase family)